jgi:hypothetical protein
VGIAPDSLATIFCTNLTAQAVSAGNPSSSRSDVSSVSFQQDISTDLLGTACVVGQDGILRGDWQSPLFGYRHRLQQAGPEGAPNPPQVNNLPHKSPVLTRILEICFTETISSGRVNVALGSRDCSALPQAVVQVFNIRIDRRLHGAFITPRAHQFAIVIGLKP